MPSYESNNFDPPAPLAHVTLRHPNSGASLTEIPLLMDTGADVTLLPRQYVEQLGIEPIDDKMYELQSFDGGVTLTDVAHLELVFMKRKFKGQFLLIDDSIGILGRNILNALALVFDGPNKMWDELKKKVKTSETS